MIFEDCCQSWDGRVFRCVQIFELWVFEMNWNLGGFCGGYYRHEIFKKEPSYTQTPKSTLIFCIHPIEFISNK
jgi:hypothetical protein